MRKRLTSTEAAARIGVAEGTLRNLRSLKQGPSYEKEAGKVYYYLDDLEAWRASRKQYVRAGDRS